ncbi:helix-turn-helix protein [Paenibacillus cellulosilyticus]|uniref:Helix-turn-helix protein n=1 Tax=Paenibacillus cellulosilyticus TaxID=375489 RepID=A0A2V2YYD0_9BACL|nr:helix-turn-helix transcriptional regulator [Paenibacillus cellulosilyticus]PWW06281.1 helix-turn-helix protein [Paenibacillus cellulosilyticus]QKS42968.1 helix-turn-helix transcriptional regulator [Paenibacillus cellulosilyticus]QKS43436.1 helix-turn-helix transcriptional regulator [Paenibacillus cellulosilyticus]
MPTFGERLKKLRDRKGISQQELADRFNLSQSTIAYYESDKKQPSQNTLQKLADFYETSVDFLLGRTQNELVTKYLELQSEANTGRGIKEQGADYETDVGRAFFGGSDKYSEEELEIARAAAEAAIKAFRKVKNQDK